MSHIKMSYWLIFSSSSISLYVLMNPDSDTGGDGLGTLDRRSRSFFSSASRLYWARYSLREFIRTSLNTRVIIFVDSYPCLTSVWMRLQELVFWWQDRKLPGSDDGARLKSHLQILEPTTKVVSKTFQRERHEAKRAALLKRFRSANYTSNLTRSLPDKCHITSTAGVPYF